MTRAGTNRSSTPLRLLVALLLSSSLLAAAACGEDVPSKADFSTEIGKVTGGRVSPDLASCVYDKLAKTDPELLKKAITTPDLSKDEDNEMQQLLAHCIIDRNAASTPKTTTTTTDGSQ
jgi:hypothetical protein